MILKIIIISVYLVLSSMIWNRRNLILGFFLLTDNTKSNKLLIAVFTIGIAILLISILIWLINELFIEKRGKYNMKKTELKNKDGKYVKYFKGENDPKAHNVRKCYFKTNGLTLDEFKNQKSQLEVAMDMKIYDITYGKNTNTVIVYGTPYKYLKPREYSLSIEDKFLKNKENYLIIGSTGSGKTYFIKILISNLILAKESVKLYLCDFKNYDFQDFDDCERYYGYTDVVKGIEEVYQIFKKRVESKEKNNEVILLYIDEYATLLSNLGKKADEVQGMVSEMLFMARSYNIVPIICMQRAESSYFKNGSRDQFKTIIAFGNLSKEQKNMLFSDFKDTMTDVNGIGEGYVYQDGEQFLQRIKVKKVNDDEERRITGCIRKGLDNK